ncbi:MAG TPA: ABC transporter substrate-binding protein [Vicinamibacterales bacterium]|nr:ABC transporter substrate-binding protein [Vicinamibacterales bacterium]
MRCDCAHGTGAGGIAGGNRHGGHWGTVFLVATHYTSVVGPRVHGPRVQGFGPKGPRVRSKGPLVLALSCVLAASLSWVTFAAGPLDRTFGPLGPNLWTLGPWTLGPTRIVSLVPAVTEMLFAIGAGADVVGVSSYDRFPPEALSKPKVGALVDPDFERILSLRPDLVVVYGTQTDLIARLDRARIPAFTYENFGLAEITATIRQLGDRLGRAAEASALAGRIDRDLAEIKRTVAGKPRPKTVLIFGREPGSLRGIYASGGVGFMHDMLEIAGGIDIFADIKRQNLQATTEMLLTRAPEVIIEVHPGDPWPQSKIDDARRVWSTLSTVPAVRTGRIYELVDDRLSIPGPRVAEAVRLLAAALHKDLGSRIRSK